MPTYVVRLIDCASKSRGGAGTASSGVGTDAAEVCSLIATWYRLITQKAGSGWTADVKWLTDPPNPLPGQDAGDPLTINMLIYFVLSPRDSVIKLHPRFSRSQLIPVENDPTTVGYTQTLTMSGSTVPAVSISEVYVTRCRNLPGSEALTLKLARTGFHESMHNQLAKGGEMHRLSAGFGAAIASGTSPNGTDIQLMADKIGNFVPQWLDGFQAWITNDNSLNPK
jgi:hypothetical protein